MKTSQDLDALRDTLCQIALSWKAKGHQYFTLAETEEDPLGKKFYESSAMTLLNCIEDLEKATGIHVLNQVDSISLSPKLTAPPSEAQK